MNMSTENHRYFAEVGISPAKSLEETASGLGLALGGVSFVKDKEGHYEEYPAYIAELSGLRYALLGIPKEEDYIGDKLPNHYVFLVEPVWRRDGESIDISDEIIEKINACENTKGWVLR